MCRSRDLLLKEPINMVGEILHQTTSQPILFCLSFEDLCGFYGRIKIKGISNAHKSTVFALNIRLNRNRTVIKALDFEEEHFHKLYDLITQVIQTEEPRG